MESKIVWVEFFLNLHSSKISNDRKTEIPLYDAAPWKKALLLSDVLQFLIIFLFESDG
jgi:hypothetical protein